MSQPSKRRCHHQSVVADYDTAGDTIVLIDFGKQIAYAFASSGRNDAGIGESFAELFRFAVT
ncbi:MAG: hypothetical protein R3D26_07265 [Cyanobacteriota/Melainabacteria group bacterium]